MKRKDGKMDPLEVLSSVTTLKDVAVRAWAEIRKLQCMCPHQFQTIDDGEESHSTCRFCGYEQ